MRVFFRISAQWKEAEVDSSVAIEQNITHDNLENPTNYISENSFSLKLPRTSHNNKMFSQFCNLDSVIVQGGYTPIYPMDFRIDSDNGSQLMSGTATITSITKESYNISLIGSLGTAFYKLLNSGWSKTRSQEDDKYILLTDWFKKTKTTRIDPESGATVVKFVDGDNPINRWLAYSSWRIDSPIFKLNDSFGGSSLFTNTNLKGYYGITDANITETMAFLSSIIGFAPITSTDMSGFDTKRWLQNCQLWEDQDTLYGYSKRVTDVLVNAIKADLSHDEVYGSEDGLIDAQIGEYRSYYLRPFIYVSRLFQLYQYECERITGYKLDLDSRWFNENAARSLKDAIYMLPPLSIGKSREYGGLATANDATPFAFDTHSSEARYQISGLSDNELVATTDVFRVEKDNVVSCDYNYQIEMTPTNNPSPYDTIDWLYENFGICDVSLMDGSSEITTKKYVVLPTSNDDHVQDYQYIQTDLARLHLILDLITDGYDVISAKYQENTHSVKFGIDGNISSIINTTSNNAYLKCTFKFANDYCPIAGRSRGYYNWGVVSMTGSLGNTVKYDVYKQMRSGYNITLGDIFGDVNPFSILLKWSKMQHLTWEVNDSTKTIIVKQSKDYYTDCFTNGVFDISDKVDMDSIEITPLSWTSESVEFNFNSTNTTKDYEDRHKRTYGSKKIITSNRITNDNTKLLCNSDYDTINPGIINTEFANKVAYYVTHFKSSVPVESIPKPSVEENSFFYRQQNSTIGESLLLDGWRTYIAITDDDPIEVRDSTYCWHGIDDGVHSAIIPSFDICNRSKNHAVLFSEPREVYSPNTYPTTMKYLYEDNWSNYINEVYNVSNKTIAIDAIISQNEYERVKYNPLCRINNILYVLCKCESWSANDGRCKLTLRQISNINNLIS